MTRVLCLIATMTVSGLFATPAFCAQPDENPGKNQKIISVPRGEQAPSATPGQRNFGGMIPQGNTPRPQRPAAAPRAQRPAPQVKTVPLTELSMSDPFIYPDTETKTYYLTSTGGSLYNSKDLQNWTGPYNVIDLSGTWMQGAFVAAAEIHKFGDKIGRAHV